MTDERLKQEVIEYVELEANTRVTSVEVAERIVHLSNEAVVFSVSTTDDEVAEWWVVGGETAMNLYPREQFNAPDEVFSYHVGILTRFLSDNKHVRSSEPPEGEKYDVFISHASEDKGEIVTPLAENMKERGAWVWYDKDVIEVGDSISRSIDNGLANSYCGIVVLSPSFFGKPWPRHELDVLFDKMNSEEEAPIYPVWHDVGKAEVKEYSRLIAGIKAEKTGEKSVEKIAENIHRAMTPHLMDAWRKEERGEE